MTYALARCVLVGSFLAFSSVGCSTYYTYKLDEAALGGTPTETTHEEAGFLPPSENGGPRVPFSVTVNSVRTTTPTEPLGAYYKMEKVPGVEDAGGRVRVYTVCDPPARSKWKKKCSTIQYGKDLSADFGTPVDLTASQVANLLKQVCKKYTLLPDDAFANSKGSATRNEDHRLALEDVDIQLLAPKLAAALRKAGPKSYISFVAEDRISKVTKGVSTAMSILATAKKNRQKINTDKMSDNEERPAYGWLWIEKANTPYYCVTSEMPALTRKVTTATASPLRKTDMLVVVFYRTADGRNFRKKTVRTTPVTIKVPCVE